MKIEMQIDAIDKCRDLKAKTDMILEDFKRCKYDLDEAVLLKEKISTDFNLAQV